MEVGRHDCYLIDTALLHQCSGFMHYTQPVYSALITDGGNPPISVLGQIQNSVAIDIDKVLTKGYHGHFWTTPRPAQPGFHAYTRS